MKTTTFRKAQEAYDRMEHPDYWRDEPECNCEDNLDDRVARWECPEHGKREPDYDELDIQEEAEALERRIAYADMRRDELRD